MLSTLSDQNSTLGLSSKSPHFDVRMTQERASPTTGPQKTPQQIFSCVSLFVNEFHCKQEKSRVKVINHRLKKEWTEFLLWKRNCSSSKSDLQISWKISFL